MALGFSGAVSARTERKQTRVRARGFSPTFPRANAEAPVLDQAVLRRRSSARRRTPAFARSTSRRRSARSCEGGGSSRRTTGRMTTSYRARAGGRRIPRTFRRDVLRPSIGAANIELEKDPASPIGPITFHSLRRTYASLRCACRDDVAYTSAQIGHAHPLFTLRPAPSRLRPCDRMDTNGHTRRAKACADHCRGNRKPRLSGTSGGADDGTRTHDLLHGKCERPFAPVRVRSLKAPVCRASVHTAERERTRANAEPCHSCHGTRAPSSDWRASLPSQERALVREPGGPGGVAVARLDGETHSVDDDRVLAL